MTMSLPSRERGLKSITFVVSADGTLVAPLAGAWIEIRFQHNNSVACSCRSPRGSVD